MLLCWHPSHAGTGLPPFQTLSCPVGSLPTTSPSALLTLPSHRAATAGEWGANTAFPSQGLQSLSKRLFWVYCDLRGSRECLQHLLHPICWGCWRWVAGALGSPLGEAVEGLCPWEGMWGAQDKQCDSQGDAGSKRAFRKTSGWWQGNSFSSFCNSVVKRYEETEKFSQQRKFNDSTYNFKFWPSLHFFLLQPLLLRNLFWMYLCTLSRTPMLNRIAGGSVL